MLPNDEKTGLASVFGRLTGILNRSENRLTRRGVQHSSQLSYGTFGDSGEEMEVDENRGSFANFFARMDPSRSTKVRIFITF